MPSKGKRGGQQSSGAAAAPAAQPAVPTQPRQPLVLPHVSKKKGPPTVEKLTGDDLFKVHGVLTPDECHRFVRAIEESGQLQHQSSRGPKFGEAYRDNHRHSVQDDAFAGELWAAGGLEQAFRGLAVDGAVPVGLNPHIRLYRYTPGQRFGKHVDGSVELACSSGGGGGRSRRPDPRQYTQYTLLVYLSGGPGSALRGGETVFYGSRGRLLASVSPEAGTALLHVHGDYCLEHEGAEVRAGAKYVLRSDVVFERPR